MKCLECAIEFEGRADAKFCSPKCRVTFSRKQSVVTDNVTFKSEDVTDNFEFRTEYKPLNTRQDDVTEERAKIRTAKYWYDVPLGAIPVMKKGYPKMPSYMNGRQYFLWWKNNFKLQDKEGYAGFGKPEIYNPFPLRKDLKYVPMRQGMGI